MGLTEQYQAAIESGHLSLKESAQLNKILEQFNGSDQHDSLELIAVDHRLIIVSIFVFDDYVQITLDFGESENLTMEFPKSLICKTQH